MAVLYDLGGISSASAQPLPFTLSRGTVPNDNYTGALAAGADGQAGWRNGRATFYDGPAYFTNAYISRGVGAFGTVIYGSCGYFETRDGAAEPTYQDLAFGPVNVAALADVDPDYPGSCGRCYEVRCKPGLVPGNGSQPQPVDIHSPNYLAGVNSTVKDTYGRSYPGNAAEAQGFNDVDCWNASTVVHIVDNCPAFQNKSGGLNQQQVCNSDTYHFDLSFYAFEQLAHPIYGSMGLEFRPMDCYTNTPFNFTGGAGGPYFVNTTGFLPGYINSTIYGDRVETGWSWNPYYLHSSEFWRPGAGVNGSNATCVTVATRAQYNQPGTGGGGLTFTCRECSKPGYQPFGVNNQLQFWVRSNSSGIPSDPREQTYPKGSLPNLSVSLNNADNGQSCNAAPHLASTPQYQVGGPLLLLQFGGKRCRQPLVKSGARLELRWRFWPHLELNGASRRAAALAI
ncbi:hypothetical protein WJX72_009058 [[Myrmecia] bisecta]|uniref:Expansin-like EG45 domain-containing protein n=1 Tax=[Myrmecia] bisecta TaxID=41462 RepID=A0AAW1Q8H9_9CHLO